MALALDGQSTVANWSGSSSTTVTLSTTNANDVIVVVIAMEKTGVNPTVGSVTATGLTFAKRAAVINSGDAHPTNTEIWWAPAAAALSSKVITITTTGSVAVDDAAIVAFGVSGAANINAPFDPNASLPATGVSAVGGNPPPAVTLSTTLANNFVIGACATAYPSGISEPSGFTSLAHANNPGGSLYCYLDVGYKIVSSPLSSESDAFGGGSGYGYSSIFDAITSDVQYPGVTEAGSATESSSVLLAGVAAVTEAGTAADTITGVYTTSSTTTEAANARDFPDMYFAPLGSAVAFNFTVSPYTAPLGNAVHEYFGVTPTTTNWTDSITEAATAGEAASAASAQVAVVTEAGSATDAASAVAAEVANILEAATASDSTSVTASDAASVTEAATATDTNTNTAVQLASAAEVGNALDSESASYIGVVIDSSDSVDSTDTVSATAVSLVSVAESASAQESATGTIATLTGVVEGAAASVQSIASATSFTAEATSATDAATASINIVSAISEASTATDTVDGIRTTYAEIEEADPNAVDQSATLLGVGRQQEHANANDDSSCSVNYTAACHEVVGALDLAGVADYLVILKNMSFADLKETHAVFAKVTTLTGGSRFAKLPDITSTF